MPCFEYHLLIILICLVKSGISLNLGKNWIGTRNKQQVFGVVTGDRTRI